MNLQALQPIAPLIAAGAYLTLLVVVFARRSRPDRQVRWFVFFLVAAIAWCFARYLPLPRLSSLLLLLMTFLLGALTAANIGRDRAYELFQYASAAALLVVGLSLLAPGESNRVWSPLGDILRGAAPADLTPLSWIMLAGWLGVIVLLVFAIWRSFRQAYFPWHANRLLFWLLSVLLYALGTMLLLLGGATWAILGESVSVLAAVAFAYALLSYRLFDVRTTLRRGIRVTLVATLSALPLILAIIGVQSWAARQSYLSRQSVALTLSIVVIAISFFFYQPFRSFVERNVRRYLQGETVDTGQVVSRYSRAIAGTLDVEQLSQIIFDALNGLLQVRLGGLMLVTPEEEGAEVEIIPAAGLRREKQRLEGNSPFLNTLASERRPLLQYDVDYAPSFAGLWPSERAWLQMLGADVYVPISAGDALDGVIVVGPKQTGLPYQSEELDLMQLLADQTVVALQNARLYRALEEQNERIRQLNLKLRQEYERLAVFDRAKTDFITIASHELRTPLAQVKGYAELLAAMSQEERPGRSEVRTVTNYVGRAADQLENLIASMLDAAELDIAGVRLNFTETRLAAVVERAVESLREALKERRLSIVVENLETLPPIQADERRLEQALANVLGNAIKYTPDYGRIVVTAGLLTGASMSGQPNAPDDDETYVELVVADSGIGIDPEYHDLIFEKFFRVGSSKLHSTGSTKFKGAGPGLGLPIARGIIAAHSGHIWVESEGEDEERLPGSRFHIVLPVKQPQAAHLPDKDAEWSPSPGFAGAGNGGALTSQAGFSR